MKIVSLMPIGKKFDPEFFYFEKIKNLVDETVILKDNSDIDIEADHIIDIKNSGDWSDSINRTLLINYGYATNADWFLSLDSDEDIDTRIKTKEDLVGIIKNAEVMGYNSISFFIREMWDKKDHYRCDGIWKNKKRISLCKNLLKHGIDVKNNLNMKFHCGSFPFDKKILKVQSPMYEIYHYGVFTDQKREDRKEKYKQNDKYCKYQSIGYDYLTDCNGLELKKIWTG